MKCRPSLTKITFNLGWMSPHLRCHKARCMAWLDCTWFESMLQIIRNRLGTWSFDVWVRHTPCLIITCYDPLGYIETKFNWSERNMQDYDLHIWVLKLLMMERLWTTWLLLVKSTNFSWIGLINNPINQITWIIQHASFTFWLWSAALVIVIVENIARCYVISPWQ